MLICHRQGFHLAEATADKMADMSAMNGAAPGQERGNYRLPFITTRFIELERTRLKMSSF